MATSKPLTQAQIVDKLASTVDLPKSKVKELLSAQAELAYKEAAKGYTVAGLGKVIKVKRKARTGRNPATGESIKIPAKTVLKFRISKIAKDAITPAKK